MNRKRLLPALGGSTILVCLIGLAASIVPLPVYSDSFWGVDTFVDKELFTVGNPPGVIVRKIASSSPVASSGLQVGDRVLAVNGTPVTFGNFRQLLAGVQSRHPVAIDIDRAGRNQNLVYPVASPVLEGVVILDWQFVSAPIFLALLLLCMATQPLEPPPVWRAIVVTLGGLAVLTVTVIFELTRFTPWTSIWRSKALSNTPSPALHGLLAIVILAAGLALSILGTFAVRAVLNRKKSEQLNVAE